MAVPAETGARLLSLAREHFPDPVLLPLLSEPGAFDDAPDVWINGAIVLLEKLPALRSSTIRSYTQTAARLSAKGAPVEPIRGERAALRERMRRALESYHAPADLSAALLDEGVLGVYDTETLTGLTSAIEELAELPRKMLQGLLDQDDKAEHRAEQKAIRAAADAATRAERDAERAKRQQERQERSERSRQLLEQHLAKLRGDTER